MFDRRFYICTLCGRELRYEMLHSTSFSMGCLHIVYVCECSPGYYGVLSHTYRLERDCVRELFRGHKLEVPYSAPVRYRVIEEDDLMVKDFAIELTKVETVDELLGTSGS